MTGRELRLNATGSERRLFLTGAKKVGGEVAPIKEFVSLAGTDVRTKGAYPAEIIGIYVVHRLVALVPRQTVARAHLRAVLYSPSRSATDSTRFYRFTASLRAPLLHLRNPAISAHL